MSKNINEEGLKLSKHNTVSDAVESLTDQESSTKDLVKKNKIKRQLDKFKNKKAGDKLSKTDIEKVQGTIFNKDEDSTNTLSESEEKDLSGIKSFMAKISTKDFVGGFEDLEEVFQDKIEKRYNDVDKECASY